jgi:hypothetical protein
MIDPNTLMPDLYTAASQNKTEECLKFLEMLVPPTYYESRTGLTVRLFVSLPSCYYLVRTGIALGCYEW